MSGPDLPPADQSFDLDTWMYRWPTGAEKVELWRGCPFFYGEFDEQDVAIARRAFPGREIVLDHGALVICPAGQPSYYLGQDQRR